MSTPINKPGRPDTGPRSGNRNTLFAVGAAVLAGVAIAIWGAGKAPIPESTAPAEPAQPQASEAQAVPSEVPTDDPQARLFSGSILTAANEPEQPEQEATTEDLNVPFELAQVAHALSRVEVDENGDIVLNEAAQAVLEQAFLDARAIMNEQQLAELKTMIEAGLEGQAGAQAVEIAEKFYRYSNAFREIFDTLAVRGDPRSLRNDYEQVARLRRTHLGPELAEELYGREEQMTRYTIEVMAIQADTDLTPEQRSEKQQELAARYRDVMPDGGDDEESPDQATN